MLQNLFSDINVSHKFRQGALLSTSDLLQIICNLSYISSFLVVLTKWTVVFWLWYLLVSVFSRKHLWSHLVRDSNEGAGGARTTEFLATLVDPKVGNWKGNHWSPMNCCIFSFFLTPFCTGQHRARCVPRHVIPLPVLMEVVPECRRPFLGPEWDAERGEDGGAALVHVGLVEQPRGDAIARAERRKGVLFFTLKWTKSIITRLPRVLICFSLPLQSQSAARSGLQCRSLTPAAPPRCPCWGLWQRPRDGRCARCRRAQCASATQSWRCGSWRSQARRSCSSERWRAWTKKMGIKAVNIGTLVFNVVSRQIRFNRLSLQPPNNNEGHWKLEL